MQHLRATQPGLAHLLDPHMSEVVRFATMSGRPIWADLLRTVHLLAHTVRRCGLSRPT